MDQEVKRPKNPRLRQAWSLRKKLVYTLLAALLVGATVVSWYLLRPESEPVQTQPTASKIPTTAADAAREKKPAPLDCKDAVAFDDEEFGMKFCYPNAWGTATLADAKLSASDTGYRQTITFSNMPFVRIGGVSDDWSTTVGRDGICFDPSNQVPELSSYNTDWNSQVGSGAELEFAKRSLPSAAGGYALTEEVSNVLQSGVCVRGYKVINSPRYRVASLSFYRDFPPASGITSPAEHVAEPNTLVSDQIRTEINNVMASLVSY